MVRGQKVSHLAHIKFSDGLHANTASLETSSSHIEAPVMIMRNTEAKPGGLAATCCAASSTCRTSLYSNLAVLCSLLRTPLTALTH